MKIEDYLPKVQKNVSLAEYNTFKIGGKAQYFFIARNKDNLIKAIKAAKNLKLPFFILGKGSNILFSDKGFKGLVVNFKFSKCDFKKNKVYAGAGVMLNKLVKLAKKENLAGMEWAIGIPGTLGGAIYGNAQSFFVRMSDIVESVEALDKRTLEIKNFSNEGCCFSLKNSIFKKNKNLMIISAVLKLKKGGKKGIEKRIKDYLSYRRTRHPLKFPSAGSVFINTEIRIENPELLKRFPELKEFNKKGVIPSAYLIEKCGLKGRKIGRAQISDKHANFIINLGGAKAKDVLALINLAKQEVKKKFGISLREEIQIIS